MTAKPTSSSRTEEVFEELRADLLGGLMEPGQRLKLTVLSSRFGVSQSVVREALTRLAEQGLAVSSPQRGFSVRPLSVADLSDLTRVRVQIESLALRQSFELGDLAWETQVLATHHTLQRTPVTRPDGSVHDAWSTAHREFHRALLAGCGSPHLENIATSLRDGAELYRRWSWMLTDDHLRDLAAEHRLLKDLALDRDADRGVEALAEHIERSTRDLIAYATEHGLDSDSPDPVGTGPVARHGRPREEPGSPSSA
ncbi:GntR family transcriptional regulator [Streptomyces griseorubiginosus]|uniref:GntR family transcriptional regulator n=1 Tax=Streptomyces griseorubiginosus TaxID=67304 RepID=UPI0027E3788A|nr:GntR family transcriptional regulator [Streptomyces griseorubiginosus]MBO4254092.1 FCD domain-containing protein [Streptomyces griseorubiginosus]